jgi:hypothetical protein
MLAYSISNKRLFFGGEIQKGKLPFSPLKEAQEFKRTGEDGS